MASFVAPSAHQQPGVGDHGPAAGRRCLPRLVHGNLLAPHGLHRALVQVGHQGDADAQSNLGNAYYAGQGVERNYTEAVKWFRRAAVQGLAEAQFNLGSCYLNGEGVEQNKKEAANWFRRAADQGHKNAAEALRKIRK